MTASQVLTPREQVYSWLHACFEAALQGKELLPRPDDCKHLSPSEVQAVALLSRAFETIVEDVELSSLRATQAKNALQEVNWDQAADLAYCLALVPALDLVEAQKQQQYRTKSVGQLMQNEERLSAMFDRYQQLDPLAEDVSLRRSEVMFGLLAASRRIEFEGAVAWTTKHQEDVEVLEESVLYLENLLISALTIEMSTLVRRTADVLLNVLAVLVARCCQTRQGHRAAFYRGLYLRWWHEVGSQSVPDHSGIYGAVLPQRLLEQLGANVGRMHAHHFTHGALLLENFGMEGEIANFSSMRSLGTFDIDALVDDAMKRYYHQGTGPISLDSIEEIPRQYVKESLNAEAIQAALVEDLIPLRYQLTPSQWTTFAQGYVQEYSDAEAVLIAVVTQVPDESLGREAEFVLHTPLKAPHFAIRACGYVLRHFWQFEVDCQKMLDEACQIAELEKRVEKMLEIVITATDFDRRIQHEALQNIIDGIDGLFYAGQFLLAEKISTYVLQTLRPPADTPQQQVFDAYRCWAQVAWVEDDNTRAELMLQAASLFIKTGGQTERKKATNILSAALSWAEELPVGGEIATTFIRHLINAALQENEMHYLVIATSMSATYSKLRDPQRMIVHAYAELANALMTRDVISRNNQLRSLLESCRNKPELADLCAQLEGLLGLPEKGGGNRATASKSVV
jgi:hypothetical protein